MSSVYTEQTRGYPLTLTNSRLYNITPNSVCTSCNNDKTIAYQPLKTTRYNANLSQKRKQAAFYRRAEQHAIPRNDTINFNYRNL